VRLGRWAALCLVSVLACGDDDGDAASAVDGLYIFLCDEDAPSCDGAQDAMWLEGGKIYAAYAEHEGDIVCREDERGTYEATATGIHAKWHGDDETPASEEDIAIVDGVLQGDDDAERVPGKRRLGSATECAALDD
jgi:hypothetical protein